MHADHTASSSAVSADVYKPVARWLHWITATLVLVLVPVGVVMVRLEPGDLQNTLFTLHESLGITVFPIVLVRLIYRLSNPPPALPEDLPVLMAIAAHATHWALYAILLINPVLGWTGVSAFGATINYFWLFELPSLVGENKPLSETVLAIHSTLGLLAAATIVLHISAALFHHFIRRDRILLRMIGR